MTYTTGPRSAPSPGDHPDHDLLADLAAEVLPDDLAGAVQDHVVACHACASLLAEAEGIRSLLRQGEPERMPDEVLARLERALVAARADDEAAAIRYDGGTTSPPVAADPPPRTPPARDELTDTSTRLIRPVDGAPTRRISRVVPPGATGPTATAAAAGPPSGRLTRMTRPAQSARRQAREEERADRGSRLRPVLMAAAAVVVVLGLGGVLMQFFSGGAADDTAASATNGEAAAPATGTPLLAEVRATGTDYTEAAMPEQVRQLLAAPATDAGASRSSGSAKASDQTSEAQGSSPRAAVGGGQQLLRSPAALRSCLTGIGFPDAQPVAVDLATYAGREAAVIVLPADGGGYDVWAVSRTCREGADGTIASVTVEP